MSSLSAVVVIPARNEETRVAACLPGARVIAGLIEPSQVMRLTRRAPSWCGARVKPPVGWRE